MISVETVLIDGRPERRVHVSGSRVFLPNMGEAELLNVEGLGTGILTPQGGRLLLRPSRRVQLLGQLLAVVGQPQWAGYSADSSTAPDPLS